MASFNIFGSSTTAQTLSTLENGYVGQNGALAVSGAAAITTTGSFDLVVLGSVTGLDSDAVFGTAGTADVLVGTTGQIVSIATTTIGLSVSSALVLANHGLISSSGYAIEAHESDGAADISLRNTGTITASFTAIVADAGSGSLTLVNSGTIELGGASTESAIAAVCGNANVQNAGTILGRVSIATSTGSTSTFTNTGLIDGSVTFGDGNDTFSNLGGRVTGIVNGGNGSDIYRIDSADIVVADSGSTGNDIVYASITYAIGQGIEALILTGTADIRGIGNAFGNLIFGNAGDNRVSGHGGNDTLNGGAGDDTLRGGSGDDLLAAGLGDDTLNGGSGVDIYDLSFADAAASVSLATGLATGDDIDTDTLVGIEGVLGTDFADIVIGSSANNDLRGALGNDSIAGGAGKDTISGGAGADTLTGDSGDDVFVYLALADSAPASTDLITDFRPGRDVIDLSAIDPDPGVNDQFVFNGAVFLPEGLPSVRVFQDVPNNLTIVEARDTAGPEVDLRIELTGLLTLTAADFVL